MKVINDYPPNIKDIAAAFSWPAIKNAVFTYGDTVYTPSGNPMPGHLEAHEATHIKQQGNKPAAWWNRYLIDPAFRLEQELEAYRAQYQHMLEHDNRATRRFILGHISKDLSGPMYGNIINTEQAKEAITA